MVHQRGAVGELGESGYVAFDHGIARLVCALRSVREERNEVHGREQLPCTGRHESAERMETHVLDT